MVAFSAFGNRNSKASCAMGRDQEKVNRGVVQKKKNGGKKD